MFTRLQMIAVLFVSVPWAQAAERGEPLLFAQIEVPAAVCHADGYAGDVRIGDLTGDGQFDIVVFRSAEQGMKPCFLAALDAEGKVLWQAGSGGEQPARPGSVTLYDLDGDGRDEVICLFLDRTQPAAPGKLTNVVVQVRSGINGNVLRSAAPAAITQRSGEGANWVHQRIQVANFRGTKRPQDLVVKLGDTLVALNDQLEVLWTYRIRWNEYSRCSAYIPAVGDIDGDGRDELNGGYYLLGPDGKPRWEKQLGRHMDSVAITAWDNGSIRAICSGFGHVVDAGGKVLLKLGAEVVPHGQEVRVADFLPNRPGPEMILRYNGHQPDAMVVDQRGTIVRRFKLNDSPNHTGMETVYWDGPDAAATLYNGGMLFGGDGTRRAALPKLPPPVGETKMGWYHCIPANVCGDKREEVVLYNPWDRKVWVYTPAPLNRDAYQCYQAGPRQYNARLMD